METFYQTIQVVFGILSPLFVFGLFNTIYNFSVGFALDKQRRHEERDFFARRWYLSEQRQPPNRDMITLVFKDTTDRKELEISIDKGVVK